jgi:CBS domain containing-hemolysin-like protein
MAILMVGGIVFLVALMVLLAVVESAVSQLSRLTLKVMAERQTHPRYALLEKIAVDRRRFLIPVHFTTQLILVVLTTQITALFIAAELTYPLASALVCTVLGVALFRQAIPYLWTQGRPERVLLRVLPFFRLPYRLACAVSFPLMSLLQRWKPPLEPVEEDDETSEEEIQAYLGVGEEEGIFERDETELIQSALEFGSTLVREIMTPRSEIVAIEEGATLSTLRDLIVSSKHSRIPVYRERIDQIVGVVNVRSLLAHLESGREQEPITPLISEILVVPENKRVADLLKEMQAGAHQIAVVVNEYGTVSGLITLEDVVEEIVGEIRDEGESHTLDLVYEGDRSYIVRGNVEVGELEDALGVEFSQCDAATVSGLVVDRLGRVPEPGEEIVFDGVTMQVLSADGRRIHTLRVKITPTAESPAEETAADSRPVGLPREFS